jgi:hypothetical protein
VLGVRRDGKVSMDDPILIAEKYWLPNFH